MELHNLQLQPEEVTRLRLFFTEISYISAVAKGFIPGKTNDPEALSRLIDAELKGLGPTLRQKLNVELLFQTSEH